MDLVSAAAIFAGAGCGALLRWWLGFALNPVFPTIPLGTLAANVAGGFLIGMTLGVFTQFSSLPPAMRLAVTTGFLGGLTTFSTFSAETLNLLLRTEHLWAGVLILAHVALSLLAAVCGMFAARSLYLLMTGATA